MKRRQLACSGQVASATSRPELLRDQIVVLNQQ